MSSTVNITGCTVYRTVSKSSTLDDWVHESFDERFFTRFTQCTFRSHWIKNVLFDLFAAGFVCRDFGGVPGYGASYVYGNTRTGKLVNCMIV